MKNRKEDTLMTYEWRGVLAGAYNTLKEARFKEMVTHAVVLVPSLELGRIRRTEGETLCRRIPADNMSDDHDESTRKCPRCLEIVNRYFGAVL